MPTELTVAELIEALQDLPQDHLVRFASQPSWPFEYQIESITPVELEDGSKIVYLGEGRQLGYLPGEAREELGW